LYGENSLLYKNKNNSFTEGIIKKKTEKHSLNPNQSGDSGELP